MSEQAALDVAKAASTKQSYETDALMGQYLALVSPLDLTSFLVSCAARR